MTAVVGGPDKTRLVVAAPTMEATARAGVRRVAETNGLKSLDRCSVRRRCTLLCWDPRNNDRAVISIRRRIGAPLQLWVLMQPQGGDERRGGDRGDRDAGGGQDSRGGGNYRGPQCSKEDEDRFFGGGSAGSLDWSLTGQPAFTDPQNSRCAPNVAPSELFGGACRFDCSSCIVTLPQRTDR